MAARATLLYLLCFSYLMKKSSWGISNFLDVLVCNISEYFCELKTFLVITAETP